MILQIASDIHIEKLYPKLSIITDFIIPNKDADILILAGDIGSIYHVELMKTFFMSCKVHFKNVIFVPGNNEYYEREGFAPKPMSELFVDITNICSETGIIMLDNSYIECPDFIIFGSSWWSHVPDTLNMKIYDDEMERINSDDFNFLHNTSRRCLNKLLTKIEKDDTRKNKKLIVITHYCPTRLGTMNFHHKKSEFDDLVPYYFSSSEKFLRSGKIDVWIYGHTHVFRDFYFENTKTRIISNADPRKRFFKPDYSISIGFDNTKIEIENNGDFPSKET